MGTTVKKVIRAGLVGDGRKGAAIRFQTASGLKGKRNSIVEPAKRGVRRAFIVPWMWWRGRQWRRRSEGLYFQALRRDWAWAVRTDDGRRTPFW